MTSIQTRILSCTTRISEAHDHEAWVIVEVQYLLCPREYEIDEKTRTRAAAGLRVKMRTLSTSGSSGMTSRTTTSLLNISESAQAQMPEQLQSSILCCHLVSVHIHFVARHEQEI